MDLKTASAKVIAATLANGTVTSLDLVDAYIQRLAANDQEGLGLHSFIEIAPTAHKIAQRLDAERASGKVRSAIHGLPIVVQDAYNTDLDIGMNSTAGSYALMQGSHAKSDAFAIKELRDAGAIILDKANQDKWSGQGGAKNSSAWSARGGRISTTYVEGGFAAGGDPGGSSGSPAVAVSVGFAAASLGTDTEGSITNPYSRAGLFGLHPSTSITSRTGVTPISSSQDTTGPLAKSVWDIAVILEILAAHDPNDLYSEAAEPFRQKSYTQFLDPNGFQGLRIGIPREPFWNQTQFGYRSAINTAVNATLERLRSLGAQVIDPAVMPNADHWRYEFVGGAMRNTAGRAQTRGLISLQLYFHIAYG
ncbi:amidase signature domain-containing protein [Phaeosphaeriaceae sp. PMI808]|nr:amidase signature domain-containing protein [Phaeosphaeriaceae sp. PMI808]